MKPEGKYWKLCWIPTTVRLLKNTFHKPETPKAIDLNSFGTLKDTMKNYIWEYALNEEYSSLGEIDEYASEQDFYDTRRWLKGRLEKPHQKPLTQIGKVI